MNFIAKLIKKSAIVIAETNQNSCAIIGFDEPKMPDFMIK